MKLAVISDIHGNLAALDAVLEDISHEGVDAVFNLGDIVSGPLDAVAVAERLMPMGLATVRGNHDRFIAEGRDEDWHVDALARSALSEAQRAWLGNLPPTHSYEGVVLLTHGTPHSDSASWMDDNGARLSREHIEEQAVGQGHEVLLCGHTHQPRLIRLEDGRLVVNPGAVGLPLNIGAPDARYAVIEKRRAGWQADLKSVAYDHEAAARRADAMGLPRWGAAFRYGWATHHGL